MHLEALALCLMLLAALEDDGANKPILMESQSIDPKVRAMPNGGPLDMLNTKIFFPAIGC